MSAQESQQELAWQDSQIAGHNIIHAALADSESGEAESEQMSLTEAASFLGLSTYEVLALIKKELLCATPDATTGDYQVDRGCAQAQRTSYMAKQREEQPDGKNVAGLDELFGQDGLGQPIVDFRRDEHSDPLTGLEPTRTKGMTQEERHQITAKNVATVLDSLDFANIRLEGAMYRVGYLEAQVESLNEQLKVLPEMRTRAARAILIGRENDILKEKSADQQAQLDALLRQLDSTLTQAMASKEQLAATKEQLHETNEQLDASFEQLDVLKDRLAKLESSKIFKFCQWAFGLKV